MFSTSVASFRFVLVGFSAAFLSVFIRIVLARGVPSLIGMAHPHSTYNSLTAGVIATTCTCTSSPTSSAATTTVTAAPAGTSSSLSNKIASAIAQAFSHSLPTIITANRDNTPPVSSTPSAFSTSICSSSAMVFAGSLAASSGTLRLPAFVSTFPSVSATTGSNSAHPMLSFASPVMATHVSSASTYLGSSLFPPSLDKAFVVGPGHAPIPAKLVSKITSSQFVDLADLLSANLQTADQEAQTFLDGKLVVSKKRRAVEIQDILTWPEAFTIFQMVMCATHTHRSGQTSPNINCLSSKLLANNLVELGWKMISPFGRMQQQLVHLTGPR